MQFNYFLGIVFLVLDEVAFLHNFFDDARIELSVSRVNGFAVRAFLEEFGIGLL
jgi:hypothetical protein